MVGHMERNVNIVKDVNGNNIVIINDIRFKGKQKKKRATLWNPKILLGKNPFLFDCYLRGRKRFCQAGIFRNKMIRLYEAGELSGNELKDLKGFVNTIIAHITNGNKNEERAQEVR